MTANRDQLKSAATGVRRFGSTTLPVSGLDVRYRSLTAREMAAHQAANFDAQGSVRKGRFEEMGRRLIVATLVDDDGNPLLGIEDLPWLGEWDSADVEHLTDRINLHLGMKKADGETIRKNSSETATDATPSG